MLPYWHPESEVIWHLILFLSTHPAALRLHWPSWLPTSHSEVQWWGFGQLWFAALPIVPHPASARYIDWSSLNSTWRPQLNHWPPQWGFFWAPPTVHVCGLASCTEVCPQAHKAARIDKCNLNCVCMCVCGYISVVFRCACRACMQNCTHKGLHIAIFEACNYVACIVRLLPLFLVFSKAKPHYF